MPFLQEMLDVQVPTPPLKTTPAITKPPPKTNDERLEIALQLYRLEPKLWFYDNFPNDTLYPHQEETLNAILENKKVVVKGGHGVGKSYLMARLCLYHLITQKKKREPCSVLIISPIKEQSDSVFMKELEVALHTLPDYFKNQFKITSNGIHHINNPNSWFLKKGSTNEYRPDNLHGQHNCLFLVEEGNGVGDSLYTVIKGALSDVGSKLLVIGNPTKNYGWFYDAFHSEADQWYKITVNAEHLLEHITFTDTHISIDGVEHYHKTKGRVTQELLTSFSAKGRHSDEYRVRVLGKFPKESRDKIIPISLINQARNTQHKDLHLTHYSVLGIDLASTGGDFISVILRVGRGIEYMFETNRIYKIDDVERIVVQQLNILSKYPIDFVVFDEIGMETLVLNIKKRHRKKEFPHIHNIVGYKGSRKPTNKYYYNNRAELWCKKLREFFDVHDGSIQYALDKRLESKLAKELNSISTKISHSSVGEKLLLESKKELKNKRIASPNLADAFSYTFFPKPTIKRLDNLEDTDLYDMLPNTTLKNDWRSL